MGETQRLKRSPEKSHSTRAGHSEADAPARTNAPTAPAPAWAAGPFGAPFALGGGAVQRKVAIGASNDAYERQADQVANRVAGGGTVSQGSISPIAPGSTTSVGQREAKTDDKRKEDKPAVPVQREVRPEDTKKDPKSAGAQLQRQSKPEGKKKDEKPASAPVQKQAKPEEKKKEEKPAAAPVQKQAKPDGKKKDEKPASTPVQKQAKTDDKKKDEKPAAVPVQKQAKPDEKKKDEKPTSAPVQKQTKTDDKKKDEKPTAAPVQKQAKPDEKKKDEKPASTPVQKQAKTDDKKKDDKTAAPVQREVKPEDKKKEEVPGTLPAQRAEKDEPAKEENGAVQASSAGGGVAATPSMESVASQAVANKGPGEPLQPATRGTLESRMGTDLSDVRVHNDEAAQKSADALNARAFTHENNIWLGRGESQSDTRLMAHEATHVVQQTGSVHRQLVQRDDKGGDAPKTPADESAPTGDKKTGLLDPKAKTLTFDEIQIPAFKAKDHRGKLYSEHSPLIRKRDYKRGNPNQRDEWRKAIDKSKIIKALEEKSKPVKKGLPEVGNQHVFKVPTKSGGKPFMIGTLDQVAEQLTTPYWGGKSKNPDAKLFDVDHIVELQLANWDTDKWANTLPNMELLESSANRSSGSLIANAIDKKVDGFLGTSKTADKKNDAGKGSKEAKKEVKANREKIKLENDIVFEKATGKEGPSVGSTDFWRQDQIEGGEHLGPVEASSLDEIGGKGKVLVFSQAKGGLGKTFLWKQDDTGSKGPSNENEEQWPKPFHLKAKSFETSGDGVEKKENLGTVTLHIPESNPKWKAYPPTDFDVKRIPGARFGGNLSREDVRSKTGKLEKKGASPIQINEFDVLPDGIFVAGQIVPDIPLIKGIGIDFEMRGDELKIFKTFKPGDFTVPKPLTVTDSSLTVFASTATGLGVEGEVHFAIEKVGEGYIKGGASTGGGFNLAGGFNFDSKLFDPASVEMKYEKDAFSIQGKLGIKEGKVKGVKSADFAVSYKEGRIDASGTVKPNIPGVEQGSLVFSYSEADGLLIAGTVELKKDIPGIAGGSLHAEVTKKPGEDRYIVKASGEATPKIPGITSKLVVSYDDGAFDASITAAYEKGMLKGSVTVGATNRPVADDAKPAGPPPEKGADKITLYGGGSVSLRLAPWLQATAAIKFLPNGEVEVTGKIGLPSVLNIFDEKKVSKNIFKIGIDIPILGFSVLGHNVGIFLEIGGGLDLDAGIGPGQLQDVELSVTYNPAHEEDTLVHGHAALHIPAHAGLRLFVSAALGAGIPLVDAKAGIELGGSLGIEGALHAAVDVDWSPKKGLVLDANAEVYAEPKFKFDITGFVLVELDLLFTTKTLYEKRWQLAAVEYGSGLRLGMKLPIHYEEGKPFNISLSDIQFEVPNIDAMSTIKGLFDKII